MRVLFWPWPGADAGRAGCLAIVLPSSCPARQGGGKDTGPSPAPRGRPSTTTTSCRQGAGAPRGRPGTWWHGGPRPGVRRQVSLHCHPRVPSVLSLLTSRRGLVWRGWRRRRLATPHSIAQWTRPVHRPDRTGCRCHAPRRGRVYLLAAQYSTCPRPPRTRNLKLKSRVPQILT